jgi:hypothetical protein
VAEFEQATNSNRIPLKNAVEAFLAEASQAPSVTKRAGGELLHKMSGNLNS